VAALDAAVAHGPDAVQALRLSDAAASVVVNSGWFVPPADIAAYGIDYKLRAVVWRCSGSRPTVPPRRCTSSGSPIHRTPT
jgi:hypothetical protein